MWLQWEANMMLRVGVFMGFGFKFCFKKKKKIWHQLKEQLCREISNNFQHPLPALFTLIFHLLSEPLYPKGWGCSAAWGLNAACAHLRENWKRCRLTWRAVSTLENSRSRQRSWRRHEELSVHTRGNRTIPATATSSESLCVCALTLNLNSGNEK